MESKKIKTGDCLVIAGIVVIGMAEVWHLAAVFLNLSFTDCAMLLGASVCILFAAGTGFLIVRRKHIFRKSWGKRSVNASEWFLWGLFALMVISQLIFIGMGNAIYRKGDMMAEVVGSFLASDSIYRINPMTGAPYTEGLPLRLKILCLPTLYGSLCKWTGLPPALIVQRIVPMVVLSGSYVSFWVLGGTLFPDEGRRRAWFLLLVSFLMWVGAYRYGMEGFDLLCCGWRGVSIRGGVLLPWTVSLSLRRRWFGIILCVLAEACIVWTFYGCGMCLAVAAGMGAAALCSRRLSKRTGSGADDRSAERGNGI